MAPQRPSGLRSKFQRVGLKLGIGIGSLAFLALAWRRGVNFETTLTIGRQSLLIRDSKLIRATMEEAGVSISREVAQGLLDSGGGYSEPLLAWLGAKHVDSVDISGFENATIIHDLNRPLSVQHQKRYSVVMDFGALEHIFQFPVALRSSLDAVRVGGHYLAVSPATNYSGHGFYQFTPELYYRVLSPANGFRVCAMLWRSDIPGSRWYKVSDPASAKHRVQRWSSASALLYIVAERVSAVDIFSSPPQQSDYVEAWNGHDSRPEVTSSSIVQAGDNGLAAAVRDALRRNLPEALYSRMIFPYLRYPRWTLRNAPLYWGKGDFTRVALRDLQFE